MNFDMEKLMRENPELAEMMKGLAAGGGGGGGGGGGKSTWSSTKADRCFAADKAITEALDNDDGCFVVSGGGMPCFMAGGAEGPLVRDIQIFHKTTQVEWNIQVSSNVEIVSKGECPPAAIAIVEAALEKLRATDIMPHACKKCKKPCKALKCSRCQKATYCSRECQKADWKRHKADCKSKE